MAISLGSNLALHTRLPLDDRTLFENIQELKDYPENFLADVCYAFVKEDNGSMYIFNRENESTDSTGKWRKFTSGGGTADVPIEKIKVNGELQTPVNKVVDITVPDAYDDTALVQRVTDIESDYAKTSEIPTKVSQLENDSNYLSSIPEEYVTETELNAKGYLTEHQDISGKVDKVEGKSLVSDAEIARLASVDNYDDTSIREELANKADTTSIPSKVSELTNDSNYQTAEQVSSTVTTEIAKVVADAPEDLNTLKEMSDWIAGHENDASAMNSAISDNKTAITALQTGKADKSEIPTTVAELTDSADYAKTSDVNDSISALQTNKADASDLTAHTDDADIHVTVENKTLWNTVEDKVDKVEGKGLSTNDLTDELKQKYDDAVTAKHTHENGTVLDKFSESNEGVLLFNGEKIESELALDSTPTKDSKNYVNSGVVYGSLFETKQKTIIDTPENYVSCASSDIGALEVVADDAIPTTTQVTLSVVQAFVPTAQVGEYYQHIDEVSHLEDYESSIYAPRDEVYDKTDIDEKVQDINDAINNIISGGYEPMSVAEFTNFYDGLAITATQI